MLDAYSTRILEAKNGIERYFNAENIKPHWHLGVKGSTLLRKLRVRIFFRSTRTIHGNGRENDSQFEKCPQDSVSPS